MATGTEAEDRTSSNGTEFRCSSGELFSGITGLERIPSATRFLSRRNEREPNKLWTLIRRIEQGKTWIVHSEEI